MNITIIDESLCMNKDIMETEKVKQAIQEVIIKYGGEKRKYTIVRDAPDFDISIIHDHPKSRLFVDNMFRTYEDEDSAVINHLFEWLDDASNDMLVQSLFDVEPDTEEEYTGYVNMPFEWNYEQKKVKLKYKVLENGIRYNDE